MVVVDIGTVIKVLKCLPLIFNVPFAICQIALILTTVKIEA